MNDGQKLPLALMLWIQVVLQRSGILQADYNQHSIDITNVILNQQLNTICTTTNIHHTVHIDVAQMTTTSNALISYY